MATKDYGKTYYPLDSKSFDTAADMEQLAESLEGRMVMSFDSATARDVALASLDTAQKRGVICHVAGTGWFGWDGTAWKQFSTTQVKCGYTAGVIEGNGHLRIPSSDCFIDGSAPSAIIAFWAGTSGYVAEFGLFDGGGALIRIFNNVSGAQVLAPNAGAVFWIAAKS